MTESQTTVIRVSYLPLLYIIIRDDRSIHQPKT